MTSSIFIKQSTVSGTVPTVSEIASSELAINLGDGHVYYKNVTSSAVELINVGSASRAETASFALTGGGGGGGGGFGGDFSGTFSGTVPFPSASFTGTFIGELEATGTLTGTLSGSASYAENASTAVLAVSAVTAITASNADTASLLLGSVESASFATTASFALKAGSGGGGGGGDVVPNLPAEPPTRSLLAWYQGGTGFTTASGNISKWDDQSGNGLHLTQSTAADQPALSSSLDIFNGYEYPAFDGVSEYLFATMSSMVTASQFTFYEVHRQRVEAEAGGAGIITFTRRDQIDSAGAGNYVWFHGNDASTRLFRISTLINEPASWHSAQLWGVANTSESFEAYKNGQHIDAGIDADGIAAAGFNAIYLGSRQSVVNTATLFNNIDIVELIVYEDTLTEIERTQVEEYLAARYHIPLVHNPQAAPASGSGGSATSSFAVASLFTAHRPIKTVADTNPYTVVFSDFTILVNAVSGTEPIDVLLPGTADFMSGSTAKILNVINATGSNNVDVIASGTENVVGNESASLTTVFQSITLQPSGGTWYTI